MRTNQTYDFGPFRLDASAGLLYREGKRVALTPKALDTLVILVEAHGNVVSKDAILHRVWNGTFVEESTLAWNISHLRKALGENNGGSPYIETIPKRGYRFAVAVIDTDAPTISPPPAVQSPQPPTTDKFRRWWIVPAALVLLIAAGILVRERSQRIAASPSGERTMLLVLPFQNLTGDPQRDYMSDGLTEEMIAQLGQYNPNRLRVIARTSAMAYRNTHKTAQQIGRELGVSYIIEGSLRGDAEHLRVTADLLRVPDQTPIWSQTYDRGMEDLLQLEEEIARSISSSIRIELAQRSAPHSKLAGALNADAHLAYLQGRYYWNKRSPQDLEKSIEYFQKAIIAQADYPQAYAGLAEAYLSRCVIADVPPRDVFPKAEAAALRALEMDNSSAEAHSALAYLRLWYDWDWDGAEAEFRKALELNPDDPTAHQWYAEYLRLMGRQRESIAESDIALKLDPLSLIINMEAGLPFYFQHQYDQAIRHFRKALELDPTFGLAHIELGWIYQDMHRYQEAIAELQKARQLDDSSHTVAALGRAYGMAGRRAEAEGMLQELFQRRKSRYVSGFHLAAIYVSLGQNEKAIDELESAYENRYWGLVWLNVGPHLDPLRSNPRFQALVARMHFPAVSHSGIS